MRIVTMIGMVSALALVGCNKPQATEATNAAGSEQTAATTEASTNSSIAVPVARPPAPAAAPALQSQPGPNGTTATINKVAVTGQILTVQFSVTGSKEDSHLIPVDQISIIDDATSKKYSVLKDENGKWMASEMFTDSDIRYHVDPAAPSTSWMKFPAPPADTKTVSITIPSFGAFDGVPVTR